MFVLAFYFLFYINLFHFKYHTQNSLILQINSAGILIFNEAVIKKISHQCFCI